MAIDIKLIHQAILAGNNVLDDEIQSGYHSIESPLIFFGLDKSKDRDRLQAQHEKGNFCLSFKYWENGKDDKSKPKKCVRIWKVEESWIEKDRFRLISDQLARVKLRYFTKFVYRDQGLRVGSQVLPAIFMDWIDGMTMASWLPQHRDDSKGILALADEFFNMCQALYDEGMAHGDLCSANILVTPRGQIKLVDYDSVYVPDMTTKFVSVTNGWPAFQHPLRPGRSVASAADDYFSQHVIYLSLLAYSRFPELIPPKSAKSLLFEGPEYENVEAFTSSEAYTFLTAKCQRNRLVDEKILTELDTLRRAVAGKWEDIPPLRTIEQAVETPAPYCTKCGYKHPSDLEKYCHRCGTVRATIGRN